VPLILSSSGSSGSSGQTLRATGAETVYGSPVGQAKNSTAKYIGHVAIRDDDTGDAWHGSFTRVFHRADGAIVAGAEIVLYPDEENDASLAALDAGHINLVPVDGTSVRAALTGIADVNLTCAFSMTQFVVATPAPPPEDPGGGGGDGGPSIASVTPLTGSTAGDTEVTLAGTGFTDAVLTISPGAIVVPITSSTDTEIVCTPPAHAAGAVSFVVETPLGIDSSGYTYVEPPADVDPTTYGMNLRFWGQFTDVGGRATVLANRTASGVADLETYLTAPAQTGAIVAMGTGLAVRVGPTQGAGGATPARYGDPWPGPSLADMIGDATSYDFAFPLRMRGGTQNSATPYEGHSPIGGSAASWGLYWHDRGGGALVFSVYGTDNADGPTTPDASAPIDTTVIVSGFRDAAGDGHLHLRINGVAVAASAKAFLPISTADKMYAGSGWSYGVHQADCEIGEDVVFANVHDLAKLAVLEAALIAKYT